MNCGAKATFAGDQIRTKNAPSCGHHDFTRWGQGILMKAKGLAHETLSAVASDGIAHPFGSHHSEQSERGTIMGRSFAQVQQKGAAIPTPSVGAHRRELRRAPDVLRMLKPHGTGPRQRFYKARRLRPRARRARRTDRPPRVELRARKPSLWTRLSLEGRYVGCMTVNE